ncbi:MAG TPA: response regulator [Terriglobia bacterium]|nr:response regulator [Terriglobia bacterium]
MTEEVCAMLVHGEGSPLAALKLALEHQGVHTFRVRNCGEAQMRLEDGALPELVFTDTNLPDGNWANVLALARRLAPTSQVIVVSRFVDTALYIEVLESQAFDFIVPPFLDSDLAHVVRCATWHAKQFHARVA